MNDKPSARKQYLEKIGNMDKAQLTEEYNRLAFEICKANVHRRESAQKATTQPISTLKYCVANVKRRLGEV